MYKFSCNNGTRVQTLIGINYFESVISLHIHIYTSTRIPKTREYLNL